MNRGDGFSQPRPTHRVPLLPPNHVLARPEKTLHPQDLLSIRERFDRVALDDGVLSRGDADELVRSLSTGRLTQSGESRAREAFLAHADRLTPSARTRLQAFFDRQVPRLRVPDVVVDGVRKDQLSGPNAATVAWDPPTQRSDGSPLTNLAGYKLHYGTAPGVYSKVVDIRDPSAIGYVVEGLTAGTWYFAAKSYDAAGNESVFSNEASKVIQ